MLNFSSINSENVALIQSYYPKLVDSLAPFQHFTYKAGHSFQSVIKLVSKMLRKKNIYIYIT